MRVLMKKKKNNLFSEQKNHRSVQKGMYERCKRLLTFFFIILVCSCEEQQPIPMPKLRDESTKPQENSVRNEKIPETYQDFLSLAKDYESKKQWCYALGAYYDAIGTCDLPENKKEAIDGYNALCSAILSGNPGLEKYDVFSLYEAWKKLLNDTEKFVSSYNPYMITIGQFVQTKIDYENKTGTYSVTLNSQLGNRYFNTVNIIEQGYKKAYKNDWTDLPKNWKPFLESSSYQYQFDIVDINGQEMYKLPDMVTFGENESYKLNISGFPADAMNLIDRGQIFLNPVACYLNNNKLPINNSVFICWNSKTDKAYDNYLLMKIYLFEKEFIDIPGKGISMTKTEITQSFYTLIMGENPSLYYKSDNYPVTGVMWDDAIYFCNKLSLKAGYTPVYSVDGEIDVEKWNFTPHNYSLLWGSTGIQGKITQNMNANGFRLPTLAEWRYASKGNEGYSYAGSDVLDEVAWYKENANRTIHPVAQKKCNGFGLYDMIGNVSEYVWDEDPVLNCHYSCGGSFESEFYDKYQDDSAQRDKGFRVVKNK